ncbi:hypothetical protein BKI52_32325 [marine bacterium AO1-C]|nr:hypothetical protein BKI52_32325 [marine bacterium AO1-C]
MKNYQFIFFLIFACFLSINISYSQGFQIPNDTCPNVPITFVNPAPAAALHQWDFCLGDLKNTPTGVKINTGLPSTNRPEGIELAFDGTNWYGFITSRSGNSILRVNYGSSLSNIPTYTNLGNIGGLLNGPMGIKFMMYNNDWYAILVNVNVTTGNNGGLIRLNFGTNLGNNSPTATSITTTSLNFATDLDLKYDRANDKYVAIACNFGTNLVLYDFGSNLTNVSPASIATANLPGSGLHSVSLQKDQNNWYGVTVSFSTPVTVNHLSFGTNLYSTPTVTNISGNFTSFNSGFDALITREGNEFFAFFLTNVAGAGGVIYQLNFGSTLANQSPVFKDLGNLGVVGQIEASNPSSIAMAIAKDQSNWFLFAVNRFIGAVGNELARVSFPNEGCNSSITSSTSNSNVDVSFFNANKFFAELRTFDNQRRPLEFYNDSLTISSAIIPNFSFQNRCLGETTILTNNSIGNDSDVLTWEWSFGDGGTSNAKSPTHAYTQPGTYTISLTPKTASGLCDNAFTQQINIRTVPKASFEINDTLAANTVVNLTNTSTNFTKNSNSTFQWIINEGVGFRYFAENPSHTFSQPGFYNIILSVTDTINGCTSVASQAVTVGAIPEVGFRLNQQACTQNAITLVDTSSVNDVVGSKIVSYQWNFGGGVADQSLSTRPDTLQNPVVTFGFATTFEITLTVTTNFGVSNTIKKTITFAEGLSSQMSTSTTNGDAPLLVNFTNQNTTAVSHLWDFGDGTTSTAPNPSHVYSNPGIYTVTYKALAANGCSIPKTQQIIASAPNDVLEVALNDLSIVGDQLQVSVTNNGNTPVTNLSLRRILNKQDTLNLQWTGVINSLASETLTFDLGSGQGDITWHACVGVLAVNNTLDAKTTDNRVCKNTLDAQISSVIIQDNQYLITVRNNAIVPIKKLNLRLDVGTKQFTETTWTGTLNANEQTNILGTLTTEQLQGAPYFCATVMQLNDTTDANSQNNLGCQDISSDFQILCISPNPAVDFINIEYFLPQTQDRDVVQLQLTNSSGKVRGRVQLLNVLPGRNTYRYNTSGLTSGVYNLMFIRGNRTIVKKILVR